MGADLTSEIEADVDWAKELAGYRLPFPKGVETRADLAKAEQLGQHPPDPLLIYLGI